MRCDCCMKNFKSEDLVNFGELIVCKTCSKKVKRCSICGQYYFDFEEMFVGNIPSCYDCYLNEYGMEVED